MTRQEAKDAVGAVLAASWGNFPEAQRAAMWDKLSQAKREALWLLFEDKPELLPEPAPTREPEPDALELLASIAASLSQPIWTEPVEVAPIEAAEPVELAEIEAEPVWPTVAALKPLPSPRAPQRVTRPTPPALTPNPDALAELQRAKWFAVLAWAAVIIVMLGCCAGLNAP